MGDGRLHHRTGEDAQILMAKVSPGFDASWGIPMLGVQTQKFDNFGL